MKRILLTTVIAGACIASSATAFAATKCNIVGSFTDSLGSTGKFTSETKGTVTNTAICASSYNLTVTKLTNLIIDITGKPKTGTCGALTGKFKFNNGGCTSATGTITIKGTGTFNDTVTRSGKLVPRPAPDMSALTGGMK